jgi:DNA-binding response OmpR family regulator
MVSHGRVLLVNTADEREMYGEFLRHHQLAVDDTDRPQDALRSLDTRAPDVVVTDFVFVGADMDGPSFIRLVREHVDKATSIIVVSGFARQEDRDRAQAAGADAFLIKPVLPRDVLYEVRRALAERSDGQRLRWNWLGIRKPAPAVDRRASSASSARAVAADTASRS